MRRTCTIPGASAGTAIWFSGSWDEGKLPIEDLITHEASPSDCQSVYDMLADQPREVLGVVFDWN